MSEESVSVVKGSEAFFLSNIVTVLLGIGDSLGNLNDKIAYRNYLLEQEVSKVEIK